MNVAQTHQGADSGKARPWKNSLLSKEEPDDLQNPIKYFEMIVDHNDMFSNLFDDVLEKREQGDLLEYRDWSDSKIKCLEAFLIVQDARGIHWICPVYMDDEPIDQKVCPLKTLTTDSEEAYRDNKDIFGTMTMMQEDYVSACSRGFENASLLFLGNRSVNLSIEYRLVAAFYLFPKEGK